MLPNSCYKRFPFPSSCQPHSQQINLPPWLRKLGSAIHIPSSPRFHLSSFPLHFCKCLSSPSLSCSSQLPPSQNGCWDLSPVTLAAFISTETSLHPVPPPLHTHTFLKDIFDHFLFAGALSPASRPAQVSNVPWRCSALSSPPHGHSYCTILFPPPPLTENLPWKVPDDLNLTTSGLLEALPPWFLCASDTPDSLLLAENAFLSWFFVTACLWWIQGLPAEHQFHPAFGEVLAIPHLEAMKSIAWLTWNPLSLSPPPALPWHRWE